MFTTFQATHQKDTTRSTEPGGSRPKRNQVQRACDWCKLTRTKCDNHRPCQNCQQTNRECVLNGQNNFRSVPAAVREVERLRTRVRDLESQVKHPPNLMGDSQAPRRVSSTKNAVEKPKFTSKSQNPIYYGESSLPFFLQRMNSFLETFQHKPPLHIDVSLSSNETMLLSLANGFDAEFLPQSQENYYCQLFWQTHQFSYPIIDEEDFRKQHKRLWSGLPADTLRLGSALVDVVLALCIQQQACFLPKNDESSSSVSIYNTLAGFHYYQRCQALLDETHDAPSIFTVQCYILSIVYLYEAGLFNKAQVMTGKAVALAIVIGLNYEPSEDTPEREKELARRIWCSLYILETQLGIQAGRTFITAPFQATYRLLIDPPDVTTSPDIHSLILDSSVMRVGFQNQSLRLIDTVRSILTAFQAKLDNVDFYSHGDVQEMYARFLTELVEDLNSWAKQLPTVYKMPRRGGEPLSTDRTPLQIDDRVPLPCQRQRIILELKYHLYSLIIYRPFIRLQRPQGTSTPLCDNKATSSINHAIALTNIVHQVHTSSEILNGLNQVFYWQINALFTLIGFACTYPISQHAGATRKAIETAIGVIRMHSTIPEAGRIADIARRVTEKVESIFRDSKSNNNIGSAPSRPPTMEKGPSVSGMPQIRTEKEPGDTNPPWSPLNADGALSILPFSEGALHTDSAAPDAGPSVGWGHSDAFWADLGQWMGAERPWPPLDSELAQPTEGTLNGELIFGSDFEFTAE